MLKSRLLQDPVGTSPFSGISKSALVRLFYTLGIETSCDDTSVAILETHDTLCSDSRSLQSSPRAPTSAQPYPIHARLVFHEKVTADNSRYGGIHPIAALDSHQANLGILLARALYRFRQEVMTHGTARSDASTSLRMPPWDRLKPDLVAVTRGPGMRSNLSVGLDTAKGLALAWSVPLVAVNHMQAHALTPRLVTALSSTPLGTSASLESSLPPGDSSSITPGRLSPRNAPSTSASASLKHLSPTFPFMSLLISGGHTLLLNSVSLTQHSTLATTSDIAIGDALDKIARSVLPLTILKSLKDTAYARALETFVFPNGPQEHAYEAPATRQAELERRISRWGWGLGVPLAETRSGSKSKSMEFCFTGLDSSVRRTVLQRKEELGEYISIEERRDLGREAMRVAFEHLASRVVMALQGLQAGDIAGQANGKGNAGNLVTAGEIGVPASEINTLVVSGGVASNSFLRTVLRAFLDARSCSHVKLSFPPVELCTDNAAMIAWVGYEMFCAGYESELSCRAIRRWSLDVNAEDRGILGFKGWIKEGDQEKKGGRA